MSHASIRHFLLVFDHRNGSLLETTEFGTDSEAAVTAYARKEQEFQGQTAIEIVLIGADSLDTVRVTHAHDVDGTVALSRYLAGLGV